MRTLLVLGFLGLFTSCGAIKSECGKDADMLCNALFGYDLMDRNVKKLINDVDLQGKINELVRSRLNALEFKSVLFSSCSANCTAHCKLSSASRLSGSPNSKLMPWILNRKHGGGDCFFID